MTKLLGTDSPLPAGGGVLVAATPRGMSRSQAVASTGLQEPSYAELSDGAQTIAGMTTPPRAAAEVRSEASSATRQQVEQSIGGEVGRLPVIPKGAIAQGTSEAAGLVISPPGGSSLGIGERGRPEFSPRGKGGGYASAYAQAVVAMENAERAGDKAKGVAESLRYDAQRLGKFLEDVAAMYAYVAEAEAAPSTEPYADYDRVKADLAEYEKVSSYKKDYDAMNGLWKSAEDSDQAAEDWKDAEEQAAREAAAAKATAQVRNPSKGLEEELDNAVEVERRLQEKAKQRAERRVQRPGFMAGQSVRGSRAADDAMAAMHEAAKYSAAAKDPSKPKAARDQASERYAAAMGRAFGAVAVASETVSNIDRRVGQIQAPSVKAAAKYGAQVISMRQDVGDYQKESDEAWKTLNDPNASKEDKEAAGRKIETLAKKISDLEIKIDETTKKVNALRAKAAQLGAAYVNKPGIKSALDKALKAIATMSAIVAANRANDAADRAESAGKRASDPTATDAQREYSEDVAARYAEEAQEEAERAEEYAEEAGTDEAWEAAAEAWADAARVAHLLRSCPFCKCDPDPCPDGQKCVCSPLPKPKKPDPPKPPENPSMGQAAGLSPQGTGNANVAEVPNGTEIQPGGEAKQVPDTVQPEGAEDHTSFEGIEDWTGPSRAPTFGADPGGHQAAATPDSAPIVHGPEGLRDEVHVGTEDTRHAFDESRRRRVYLQSQATGESPITSPGTLPTLPSEGGEPRRRVVSDDASPTGPDSMHRSPAGAAARDTPPHRGGLLRPDPGDDGRRGLPQPGKEPPWDHANDIKKDNSRFAFTKRGVLVSVPTDVRQAFLGGYVDKLTDALMELSLLAELLEIPGPRRGPTFWEQLESMPMNVEQPQLRQEAERAFRRRQLGPFEALRELLSGTSSDGGMRTIRDLLLAAHDRMGRLDARALTDEERNELMDEVDELLHYAAHYMELAGEAVRAFALLFTIDSYRQGTLSRVVRGDYLEELLDIATTATTVLIAKLGTPLKDNRWTTYYVHANTRINKVLKGLDADRTAKDLVAILNLAQGAHGLAGFVRGGFGFINSGMRLSAQVSGGAAVLRWRLAWAPVAVSAERVIRTAGAGATGWSEWNDLRRSASAGQGPPGGQGGRSGGGGPPTGRGAQRPAPRAELIERLKKWVTDASPAEREAAKQLRTQYHQVVEREVGKVQDALRARGANLEEYSKGSFNAREALRVSEREYVPSELRPAFAASDALTPSSFEGMVSKVMRDQGGTREQALRTIAEKARTAFNKDVDDVIFGS